MFVHVFDPKEVLVQNLVRKANCLSLDNESWSNARDMDASTKRIALQRVKTLFRLAREILGEDPDLAQRYVSIARKVAMAAEVSLPKECRRQVCRNCKNFILPGVNCYVRIQHRREPHLVITCLKCGDRMRIPLRKRRKKTKL